MKQLLLIFIIFSNFTINCSEFKKSVLPADFRQGRYGPTIYGRSDHEIEANCLIIQQHLGESPFCWQATVINKYGHKEGEMRYCKGLTVVVYGEVAGTFETTKVDDAVKLFYQKMRERKQ